MTAKFRLITEVLAETVRTGRPEITRRDELVAEFGSVEAFLLALHQRWRTAFFARLDALLEDRPDDLAGAVVALWADPTTGGRGLGALLDAHADEPALAAAQKQEQELLRCDLGIDVSRPASPARPAARRFSCPWRRRAAA
jgi:hypothetical protein